jgi:hypothetical protein
MSEQSSRSDRLHGRFVVVPACFVLLGVVPAGCGSDYARRELELRMGHYGMKSLIEPDEPFEVGLFGNGAYPMLSGRSSNFETSNTSPPSKRSIGTPMETASCPTGCVGSQEARLVNHDSCWRSRSMIGSSTWTG